MDQATALYLRHNQVVGQGGIVIVCTALAAGVIRVSRRSGERRLDIEAADGFAAGIRGSKY